MGLPIEHQELRKTMELASQRARHAGDEVVALKQQLDSTNDLMQKSREDAARANTDLLSLKKLVDEHTTGQQRADELAKIHEAEIQDLKFQLSKTTSELTIAQRDHSKTTSRLQADLDAARSEAVAAQKLNRELEAQVHKQNSKITHLEAQREELEQAEQRHGLAIELVRTEAAEVALREREKFDQQLAQLRLDGQALEDRAVADRRDREAALREVESYRTRLEQEKATVAAQAAEKTKLEAQVVQQHLVLADLDKINGDLRAELASVKARLVVAEERAGRTVVSGLPQAPFPEADGLTFCSRPTGGAHPGSGGSSEVRRLQVSASPAVINIVYECRLQNAEMDRMRADRDKRDAYVRTLERARATLTQSLEDVR